MSMDQVHLKSLLLIGGLSLCVTACSPIKETRGNMVSEQNIQRIEPYLTSKDQLRQMFGTPLATSLFNGDKWYYVGQKTEQTAFFDPEVTERQIIAVHFTEEGFVERVEQVKSQDYDVAFVDRETPTSGHDLTLMQQLLGNIGRFTGESDNPAVGGI